MSQRNATVDWDKREEVRASMCWHIPAAPTKHRYPPDKQELAIVLVRQRAEIFPAGVVA